MCVVLSIARKNIITAILLRGVLSFASIELKLENTILLKVIKF